MLNLSPRLLNESLSVWCFLMNWWLGWEWGGGLQKLPEQQYRLLPFPLSCFPEMAEDAIHLGCKTQRKMKTELKAFFLLAQFHSARRSNTGWGGTARYPWSQSLRTLQLQYQPAREEVPTHAVVAWLLGGKWQSIIGSEAHSTRIIPCLVLLTHVRAHDWGPLRPIWDN